MRRTNVLTNPLSPELDSLRRTKQLNQTNMSAIDSIHNIKNTNLNESSFSPTEHAADCRATIMEDEEENEQRRLGNCPHGTPSRVPLIAGQRNFSNNVAEKHNSLKGKRERLGATFHRHTFNTFQRGGTSNTYMKPTTNCETYANIKRNRRSYCMDIVEGSDDDDDEYMQHNSGCYMLNRLEIGAGNLDEHYHEDDEERAPHTNMPQIPITLVVLLLISYICLGAGIFARWENWSLIDGAYFCFVTLTTIGYGDFVPEQILNSADIHLFTFCAYLLIGLILVAMSLSILETQLLWKCKRIAVRLKLIN